MNSIVLAVVGVAMMILGYILYSKFVARRIYQLQDSFVTPAHALAALAPTAPSLWERLASLRAALAERGVQRRLYRSTLAELDALSDRDLSDLGLTRAVSDLTAPDQAAALAGSAWVVSTGGAAVLRRIADTVIAAMERDA